MIGDPVMDLHIQSFHADVEIHLEKGTSISLHWITFQSVTWALRPLLVRRRVKRWLSILVHLLRCLKRLCWQHEGGSSLKQNSQFVNSIYIVVYKMTCCAWADAELLSAFLWLHGTWESSCTSRQLLTLPLLWFSWWLSGSRQSWLVRCAELLQQWMAPSSPHKMLLRTEYLSRCIHQVYQKIT